MHKITMSNGDIEKVNLEDKIFYFCDPTLGDDPKEIIKSYADHCHNPREDFIPDYDPSHYQKEREEPYKEEGQMPTRGEEHLVSQMHYKNTG